MRALAVGFALLALLGAGAVEVMWRIEHPILQSSAPSPDGSQVGEVRSMPEGSAMPYGIGVFLRPKFAVLLSVQSELAFAAYCGTLTTQWAREQQLTVDCELLEGTPFVPGPVVGGTAVQVSVQPKQAANQLLKRTSASRLRRLASAA